MEMGTQLQREKSTMKNKNLIKDLTGQKFGRLTVIGIDDKGTRKTYWLCQCDCGNFKSVRTDSLTGGLIRSCGCLKKEQDKINLVKHHSHKQSGTRLYQIWLGIRKRCFNEKDARYMDYGGRGITVCDEWKNDFVPFYEWALSNGYSDDLTIERIDNNKGYAPNNCRWATIKEQCQNRRSNILITIGNTTKNLTQWCEMFNLDSKMVFARYHRMTGNGDFDLDELFKG